MPYADLLAGASGTAQQVERLLLAWAERVGAVSDLTAKSRKFTSHDGVLFLYFYPTWETIEFTLATIRSADPQAAGQIARSLTQFSDRTLSDKNPNVPIARVVDQGERFETEVLGPYIAARLAHSSRRPSEIE
jgi:hypothetical protein